MVEEGRVFCPHCGGPQIRVLVAETVPATPLGPAGGTSTESVLPASDTVPIIAIPMRWSQATRPCAIAGLIGAIGMVSQLINPVIAAIGVGFLAVVLYRRHNPETSMQARTGTRIGAVSGLFCSGITAVFATIRVVIWHEGGAVRQALLDAVQKSNNHSSDPQYQATLEFMRSDAGLALMLVCLLIVGLAAIMLLSMLGGAVGGASFGRRDRS